MPKYDDAYGTSERDKFWHDAYGESGTLSNLTTPVQPNRTPTTNYADSPHSYLPVDGQRVPSTQRHQDSASSHILSNLGKSPSKAAQVGTTVND